MINLLYIKVIFMFFKNDIVIIFVVLIIYEVLEKKWEINFIVKLILVYVNYQDEGVLGIRGDKG